MGLMTKVFFQVNATAPEFCYWKHIPHKGWALVNIYGESVANSNIITDSNMVQWAMHKLIVPHDVEFKTREVWPRIFKVGNGYNIAFGLDERMYCIEHDYSVSHSDMLSLYDWLSKENFPKNSEVTDKKEMERVLKVFEALGGKAATRQFIS